MTTQAQAHSQPQPTEHQTNAVFAKTNPVFKAGCVKANLKPTRRQASKFRRNSGLAWLAVHTKHTR